MARSAGRGPRRRERLDLSNGAAKRQRSDAPECCGQHDAGGEPEDEPPNPRVAPDDGVVRWAPGRRQVARCPADASHTLAQTRGGGVKCPAIIGPIAATEPEQKTEMMHLEQIGECRRVRAREQLVDVLE